MDSGVLSCSILERMLDVMLPNGGCSVWQIESYFDESGSHSDAHVLCVGGYIFGKSEAVSFSHQWANILAQYELPYFHMVDCAHGNPPFDVLSYQERIDVERFMIALIKDWALQGIGVTINSADFEKLMPAHPWIGSAYSFAAHILLAGVRAYIDFNEEHHRSVSKAAYFFESGHASRGEADRIMTTLFLNKKARAGHRYAGHAFLPKEEAPPLQAADLLAWQWYTDRRHKIEGKPRRKDCAALLEHPHNLVHIGSDKILKLAERFGFEKPSAEQLLNLHFGDLDAALGAD